MSDTSCDVVIVGAGIVGSACACECAHEGLRVAVIDQDAAPGGATSAAMGHIVVMDDSEAQFALTRYSQVLWYKLRSELPADAEYDQCGTIWVASDEEEMTEARRKAANYGRGGVPAQLLTTADLERLEPKLRKGMAGGLLVPQDSVLYPPAAARFLLERAREKGARLHLGRPVEKMGRGRVQLADGSEFSAAVIVNAAGTWAPALTVGVNVTKRKGHLLITDRHPGFLRHELVELGYLKSVASFTSDSVAFNIQPRKTGQLLIGSSRQFGADTKEVDHAVLRAMLARAQQYMPELGRTSAIRVWTGFRAATPDKLPLIGPSVEDSTIYLATGHEGLGITTSLATAKLMVDQLTGRNPEIPAAPYLPSRTVSLENAHA
ncbi:MAG: FAD-binding oxidoreductase [Acidobacteria bacterium]|nr:FAD-binding oxidoreductase [Acidobacteriota bacterium]